MEKINQAIKQVNLDHIYDIQDVNDKWSALASTMLGVIDFIAPLKTVRLKDKEERHGFI